MSNSQLEGVVTFWSSSAGIGGVKVVIDGEAAVEYNLFTSELGAKNKQMLREIRVGSRIQIKIKVRAGVTRRQGMQFAELISVIK